MEPDQVVESTLKLQQCLQTFITRVEELRNEDDPLGNGFDREFKVIRDIGIRDKEEGTYPSDEGRKLCNIKKNRYKDILPYDDCRVTLDPVPGEEDTDYINASFIQDQYGSNCYIASQGPVPNTVYDFWRMILQYKVKVVVMACRLIEMGRKKCECYWPEEVNEKMEFKNISVTLVSEEELGENCVARELVATDGTITSNVTQFHYVGWPDHGIPNDFDVILEMMAEMRDIKAKDPQKAPMVIHCSAGCGRTGTICAIDYAWDVLKTGNMDGNFDLNALVRTMRTQRPSMIQTPEQYMMLHVTVQTLFQKHLDLMEDHIYGNVDFPEQGASGGTSNGTKPVYKKRLSLQTEIENTLKSITNPGGTAGKSNLDDSITSTGKLQEPLMPIQASPPPSPTKSGAKPSLPRKPSTETPPTKPALTAKPSIDAATSSSGQETTFKKGRGGSFKVLAIQNIPSAENNDSGTGNQINTGNQNSTGNKPIEVKMRYLGAVDKTEAAEKKNSFVSTMSGRQDLEDKKKMFEKTDDLSQSGIGSKHKSSIKRAATVDASFGTVIPPKADINSNIPTNHSTHGNQKQPVKPGGDNKFVTVLTVGGSAPAKPAVSRTASTPHRPLSQNPTSGANVSKAKTLPAKTLNPFKDQPQSSVPPDTPGRQTGDSVYSVATIGHHDITASSDKALGSSSSYTNTSIPTIRSTASSDNSYSTADYTLHNGSQGKASPVTVYDPYSYVDNVNTDSANGDSHQRETTGVTEDGDDASYAIVNKPWKEADSNVAVSDAIYESVDLGPANNNSNKEAPPIPDRNYHEPTPVQTQAPNDSTLGKRAKINIALKSFGHAITGKGPSSTQDNVNLADIPGYKVQIGRKPQGPKDTPTAWKMK